MFVFEYEEAVIGTANQISYTRLKTHNYWSVGKKKNSMQRLSLFFVSNPRNLGKMS